MTTARIITRPQLTTALQDQLDRLALTLVPNQWTDDTYTSEDITALADAIYDTTGIETDITPLIETGDIPQEKA
ncbi:hypothetical protein EP30_01150 [Bifidobacterium sp. UTCIF-39]|uniref:hypothetical protein n=1 Tax=Bifidobacterium sp. UTCIF-39 TaxID=1465359 RepID=UPI001128FB8A|nr:hypothetical protein [Bifidobacterium sp. UTCIF-39]TPF97578.1 hypothetical protein EP30_01150 [Bifidobacterium sp. UTCIF-39]